MRPPAVIPSPDVVFTGEVEPPTPHIPTDPALAAPSSAESSPMPGFTESMAVVSDPRELEVDLKTLTVPICRTDPSQGGEGGFGTVPRNAPSTGNGPIDTTDENVARALGPMASWLRDATVSADVAWRSAISVQDYARSILVEGRRTWLMCGAVAATSDSVRAHQISLTLANALNDMQIWLTERLETLRSDAPKVRESDETRVGISAELRGIQDSVELLARELGDPDLSLPDDIAVSNPLLEIELDVPSGWFILRNGIEILLAAPFTFHEEGVVGLGVPGWNTGTAIRLRRFRHEEPWTLSGTEGLMDSLYRKFGDQSGHSTSEFDGNKAVRRTYESQGYQWTSFVVATFVEQRSYLVLFECPSEHREYCAELLGELIDGVRLRPG